VFGNNAFILILNKKIDPETLGRDISRTTNPIRTKIPPFDSPRLDESNGDIFVRIGSVVREISHPKVSGFLIRFLSDFNPEIC